MSSSSENRLFLLLFLSLLLAGHVQAAAQSRDFRQAPKALSALKQGQQAQSQGNLTQAIHFYCAAATTGNPEGYFRIGRLLATGPGSVRNPRMANAYLAMAIRLGNQQAARYYNSRVGNAVMGDQCGSGVGGSGGYFAAIPTTPFNLEAYLARQSPAKQKLATMLRHAAKLDSRAVSPKNAQGLMQLIPETQQRFGVTRPFDPEQNIKGGVAYLKWLHTHFDGNWTLMSAAYNAGEKSVEQYGGIPPYQETQQYVRRVLYFAGHKQP